MPQFGPTGTKLPHFRLQHNCQCLQKPCQINQQPSPGRSHQCLSYGSAAAGTNCTLAATRRSEDLHKDLRSSSSICIKAAAMMIRQCINSHPCRTLTEGSWLEKMHTCTCDRNSQHMCMAGCPSFIRPHRPTLLPPGYNLKTLSHPGHHSTRKLNQFSNLNQQL